MNKKNIAVVMSTVGPLVIAVPEGYRFKGRPSPHSKKAISVARALCGHARTTSTSLFGLTIVGY